MQQDKKYQKEYFTHKENKKMAKKPVMDLSDPKKAEFYRLTKTVRKDLYLYLRNLGRDEEYAEYLEMFYEIATEELDNWNDLENYLMDTEEMKCLFFEVLDNAFENGNFIVKDEKIKIKVKSSQ